MNHYQEDKIISEFLDALGPWREFIVIGGGFALFVYKLYLADPALKNSPIGTKDIDSLIPQRVPEISKKTIASHLKEAGFKPIFKDLGIPPTEGYTKEIDGVEVEIEFLTDSACRHAKSKNKIISGIVAQPLSYLTLSLQVTRNFQTYKNKKGRVVSPGAWIFHKGLTFTKRQTILKMFKDLYGIWYVASRLGEFSDTAQAEFNNLTLLHPKWFQTFKKNLHKQLAEMTPEEWLKLENQDPSGHLKKLNFEHIIPAVPAGHFFRGK